MLQEHFVPPFEPYKAATTIPPGYQVPLPPGARRASVCTRRPHSHLECDLPCFGVSKLLPCHGVVVREQLHQPTRFREYTTLNVRHPKPTATVIPTTVASGSISQAASPFSSCEWRRPDTTDAVCQTDDIGIDMDLLLHIEDMIRTQRSLTLPKHISDEHVNQCEGSSLHQKVKELQEALFVQGSVNNDLKRLLVSALAGNSDLAYKLMDLTSDNANLAGKSDYLAAQKAALAEIADTAGIAADVWRAKCLAGRVVATEAARRLTLANRQLQLVRHGLAHLLGERARLRRELGQTASLLHHSLNSHPTDGSLCHHVVQDTLDLASLCHRMALAHHPISKSVTSIHSVVCKTDTPGERLALRILMNDIPENCLHANQTKQCPSDHLSTTPDVTHCDREISSIDLSTLVPAASPPDSDDFIEKAIQSFSSSRTFGSATPHVSSCRGCNGELTTL